jgi:hypothetical protein
VTFRALPMQRACRQHLLAAPVAVCAGHNLAATATGYTKSPGGHFITEGFAVGMEILVSGFTTPSNNGVKLITAITELSISVAGGATAEGAGNQHRIEGVIPTRRAWENVAFAPEEGFPYILERWLGGPTTLVTTTRDGWVEATPQYQIILYTPTGVGMDAAAAYADAILAHFRPGVAITDATGVVARVRGDTGPFRAALALDTPGFAALSVTIPLRVETRNI